MSFYKRNIESKLQAALADTPVVCLLGARQVGKTTLVQELEPKREYYNFDDAQNLTAAKADPLGFLESLPEKVILDEIQRVPELLPAIKTVVDKARLERRSIFGRFLLTGSANLLLLPSVSESLAGRMEIINLHPLTEHEKQQGTKKNKEFLLKNLLLGNLSTQAGMSGSISNQLANAVCRGGYPEPNDRTENRAARWYQQYVDAILEKDVKDIAAIQDEKELKRLLELSALRTANLLNCSNLAGNLNLGRCTVERYLSVLEKLFLIRILPPWHRNTAKRLIKTPKIHLMDTGLACALQNLNTTDWNKQPKVFGHLLESFVVQQLIAQADWLDEPLKFFHYRDKDKVEVDLVIEKSTQIFGIEVKRAAQISVNDAKGLQRLKTQAGKSFSGGMLLYGGNTVFPIKNLDNCYAVPLSYLWKI